MRLSRNQTVKLINGVFLVVVLGIGVVMSLGAVVVGFQHMRGAQSSRDWPTTPGRVISSDMMEVRCSAEDKGYMPHVSYEYAVGETQFVSNRIAFGEVACTKSPEPAQQVLVRYPVGTHVLVSYNPGNPQSAVLETGEGIGDGASLLVVGALVVVVFGAMLVDFVRHGLKNFGPMTEWT